MLVILSIYPVGQFVQKSDKKCVTLLYMRTKILRNFAIGLKGLNKDKQHR